MPGKTISPRHLTPAEVPPQKQRPMREPWLCPSNTGVPPYFLVPWWLCAQGRSGGRMSCNRRDTIGQSVCAVVLPKESFG